MPAPPGKGKHWTVAAGQAGERRMRALRPHPPRSTNAEDSLAWRKLTVILLVGRTGPDQGGSCCGAKPWGRLLGNAPEAATSKHVGGPPPPLIRMPAPVAQGPNGCAAIRGPLEAAAAQGWAKSPSTSAIAETAGGDALSCSFKMFPCSVAWVTP